MLIGLTQRVDLFPSYGERRDGLDQRWFDLLNALRLEGVGIPNNPIQAEGLLRSLKFDGFILTGGGDLAQYGGGTPERDQVESLILSHASGRNLPVLGVCRGMQTMAVTYGADLVPIEGHVGKSHIVEWGGERRSVNSFHNWAVAGTDGEFDTLARAADDGSVEAMRHRTKPLLAVMWHPERQSPFDPADLVLIREFFAEKRSGE